MRVYRDGGLHIVILLVLYLTNSVLTARDRDHPRNGGNRNRMKHQQQLQLQQKPQPEPEEKHSEFVKGKICIGTNGRMSVPSNRDHHYRNLRDRYTNCTYVDGNLELTWLRPEVDLSFVQHIREVTGYVLISHVDVQNIILPRLQIIRGRTLFKVNIMDDQFGLFVTYSQMDTLEMPALRDILAGSVGLFNNYNLCYMKDINWEEIIADPKERFQYNFNFTAPERECPPCHSSCVANCWGEGSHNCQKFSKTNCSPQCAQGRCFGPKPRECCHLFCAGGCTGPTQKDCLACRNFYDDGVCKQECPPMQKYNPTNYLWEPNPDGKYAYGATCVRNCPEHLLKDNGACVRTCPINKTAKNGECVPCNGPCPKTCPGVGVVHSGNIESFRNCTIIEGSLEILDQSFDGYQQVYANFSFGPRFIKMHPDRLEVFSTLREVTGYINIQGFHAEFTNMSYFRNLEVIGGRQLMDTYFASLYIVKTALRSLEVRSLKRINSGAVVILENKDLCYAEEIDWNQIKKSDAQASMIHNNRNQTECKTLGFVCSSECTSAGCWGPGPQQCLECKNVKFNGTCLNSCNSQPNIYQMDSKQCGECHSECKHSCTGPNADNCSTCMNVKNGKFCVAHCPDNKYNRDGVCVPCHDTCLGCTGPDNTIGKYGCITCDKAIVNDKKIERCLKKEESCPVGYYHEWVLPQEQGSFQSLAGKTVCKKCHPLCKICTGYGIHEQVCQQCSGYKRGEQCEDECPSGHYADERIRECITCDKECRGCTGPGPSNCLQCQNYKIYNGEANVNNTSFNCTSACTDDYPHKVYPEGKNEPYCSAVAMRLGLSSASVDSTIYLALAIGFVMIISLVSVGAYWHCRVQEKTRKETVNMARVMAGCDDAEPLRPSNVSPNLTQLRVIKEQELQRGALMGSGAFGRVYKGVWRREHTKFPVAIKVLVGNGSDYHATKEFLDEAYVMASLNHPNLLKLLGLCMSSHMMLVTQLMPLGSLLEYVKTHKDQIGSKALLSWSKQIAEGMAHLEKNNFVHRDLAARNVLVQGPSLVKITDFGLAKLLDSDSKEYKSDGGKMAIKWLALECIAHRLFSTKSDVWAYGVTIWELLKFGARPFEDVAARDMLEHLESGGRLDHPEGCSLEVYFTLLSCWSIAADARPTFKQLVDTFKAYAEDPKRYVKIKGDEDMRLPRFTDQDAKDLILRQANPNCEIVQEREEYLSAKRPPFESGPSHHAGRRKRYIGNPRKMPGDDETDANGSEVAVGDIKVDLPLDEDDYLMPTSQSGGAAGGYMDLIGTPACIDNPEYLMGTTSPNDSPLPIPTQTLGIPVVLPPMTPNSRLTPMMEGEQTSEHEYYNDLRNELVPLQENQRNETTV